jgi:hypothetical protein
MLSSQKQEIKNNPHQKDFSVFAEFFRKRFETSSDIRASHSQAKSKLTKGSLNRLCRTIMLALSCLNEYIETLYNKVMTERTYLPKDEVSFIDSLDRPATESRLRALWESGWSLSILGESLNPQRPKTTIHFWVKRAAPAHQNRPIPQAPPRSLTTSVPTKNAPRLRSVSPGVPPDMKPRLRELSALARRYRARTMPDSPLAQANRDLTAMAVALRSMGVPTAAIAEAAGVSYRAMARRLSR